MFIPINAKADVAGSKKGKLTPAQNAQLNAWCLANKTGILDCLGKCEATAVNYSISNNIATVKFKKGYIVICGRLIECEENTSIDINTNELSSGKIILRFDLSSNGEEEFKLTVKNGSLIQNDLNDLPQTGVYEFELYSYTSTASTLTLAERTQDYVPDIGGKLEQFEQSLTAEGKPLGGYRISEGTIEERLTRLGFKEGSVSLSNGTATRNQVARQGNRCILNIVNIQNGSNKINKPSSGHAGGTISVNLKVGNIGNDFLPEEEVLGFGYLKWYATYAPNTFRMVGVSVKITQQGDIYIFDAYFPDELTNIGSASEIHIKEIYILSFGYEAKPL